MANTIKYTKPKVAKIAKDFTKALADNPQVLFLHRLITLIPQHDLTVDTAYQLAQSYEVFGKVWTLAKSELECRLIEKGLNRETDASLTKFCLSANYSWKEKSEVTNIESVDTMPDFSED